ncbi:MAG TPA: DUF1176 domain-containing protein [Caulobacteraceae bacterium]|nr:DUF1176 domain-containing protein [Caulobacteraceae bacterium]
MKALVIGLAASLAVATGAHAAGIKQVKDWIGVCANTGACTAVGFGAEEDATGAYLMIERSAGPAAQPKATLVFDAAEATPAADWILTIDDHPVAGLGSVHANGSEAGARAELTGRAAAALIAALRAGDQLAFAPPGKDGGDVSLAGSAAVLLWIDDQQGRVGTVTALARPGPKPAASVPPAIPPPLIAPAPAVDQKGVPGHAPRSMIKGIGDCDLDPAVKDPDDIVARLASGLLLWGPQCTMGAYNEGNVFFLGNERGGSLRRVDFPEPPGASAKSDDLLINAEFDPKTQSMSMRDKARGIGDCGELTTWVWDGGAFRVTRELSMPACRGMLPEDWPVLFASRQK